MSSRWRALVAVLGIAGLAIAAYTSVDDVRQQALPSLQALTTALLLQFVALLSMAQAWIMLFPSHVDAAALARGLYTSQLTKYLPAGGFFQAASQVALSSQDGMASAAVRLPVFSLCAIVAAATVGSGLALDSDLPGWTRSIAALGLAAMVCLDRRVLQAVVRTARRLTPRIPEPTALPSQQAILRCYVAHLVNLVSVAAAFAVLLGDLTRVELWVAGSAFAAAWAVGYVVLPIPSGIGVREAVLVAVLPGLATGSLLAASVAQRLLLVLAEAVMTGTSTGRAALAHRGRVTRSQRCPTRSRLDSSSG